MVFTRSTVSRENEVANEIQRPGPFKNHSRGFIPGILLVAIGHRPVAYVPVSVRMLQPTWHLIARDVLFRVCG